MPCQREKKPYWYKALGDTERACASTRNEGNKPKAINEEVRSWYVGVVGAIALDRNKGNVGGQLQGVSDTAHALPNAKPTTVTEFKINAALGAMRCTPKSGLRHSNARLLSSHLANVSSLGRGRC